MAWLTCAADTAAGFEQHNGREHEREKREQLRLVEAPPTDNQGQHAHLPDDREEIPEPCDYFVEECETRNLPFESVIPGERSNRFLAWNGGVRNKPSVEREIESNQMAYFARRADPAGGSL